MKSIKKIIEQHRVFENTSQPFCQDILSVYLARRKTTSLLFSYKYDITYKNGHKYSKLISVKLEVHFTWRNEQKNIFTISTCDSSPCFRNEARILKSFEMLFLKSNNIVVVDSIYENSFDFSKNILRDIIDKKHYFEDKEYYDHEVIRI